MATFHLQVISPEKVLFEGETLSLTAPGADGYFGVLANHAPLLSALKPGRLSVRRVDEDGRTREDVFQVETDGFLEVQANKVVVLAERIGMPVEMPYQMMN